MPSKSKAQHNLMAMVAHDPKAAKRMGIPQSVGQEFMKADKGRKFGSGGNVKKEMKAANIFAKMGEKKLASHERREAEGKEKDTPEMAKKEMAALRKAKAPKDVMEYEKSEHAEMGMKRGGKVKRMADGGMPEVTVTGTRRNPKYGEAREPYYRKSDDTVVLPDNALYGVERDSGVQRQLEADEMGPDVASDITDRASTPYRKGGSVGGGFRRVADGIASKGKTKGTMVRMASGGSVSSASRRADGIAQRGKTRGRMV